MKHPPKLAIALVAAVLVAGIPAGVIAATTGTTLAPGDSFGPIRGCHTTLSLDATASPANVDCATSGTTTTTAPTTTTTTAPAGGGNCTAPVVTETGAHDTYNTDPGSVELYWANNDAWNGSAGPQSLQVCSPSSWNALSTQVDNMGQVETYPDTEIDVNGRGNPGDTLSSLTSATSTFAEAAPASGWAGDAGYDVWTNNWSGETMFWNDVRGTQTFWSNCAEPGPDYGDCVAVADGGSDTSGGIPDLGVPVTLGGVGYHFFSYGAPGSNDERVFVRDTPVTSGSVDLKAAYNFEIANGWASSSDVLTQVEYGFEIAATTGTQTFPLTGYTVTLNGTTMGPRSSANSTKVAGGVLHHNAKLHPTTVATLP